MSPHESSSSVRHIHGFVNGGKICPAIDILGQLDLLDPFLSNVCSYTLGFLDNILNNVNAAHLGN